MRCVRAFLAVVLLISSLMASLAIADSGKGKFGDLDRGLRGDKMDRALDRELDSGRFNRMDSIPEARLNEQFTNELKDLKEKFDVGGIDKSEFDRKAADLKAGFLKNLKEIEDYDFNM